MFFGAPRCKEKFFHFGFTRYYSQNNIGSTTLLTDKDGSDIGQFLYTPFGEMWVDEASSVDISHITRFFTNQQYDKESGLYYYNARYYDPHLGSFITPDPAMDGINHYNYCNANPIKYTDPMGLEIIDVTGIGNVNTTTGQVESNPYRGSDTSPTSPTSTTPTTSSGGGSGSNGSPNNGSPNNNNPNNLDNKPKNDKSLWSNFLDWRKNNKKKYEEK